MYAAGAKSPSSNAKDGGEETVTLTAAQSGVPAHSHSVNAVTSGGQSQTHTHQPPNTSYLFSTGSGGTAYTTTFASSSSGTHTIASRKNGSAYWYNATGNASVDHTHTVPAHNVNNNTAANATSAHNNMPPYKVVYMWQRIG